MTYQTQISRLSSALAIATVFASFSNPAFAKPLKVVADIAPVHSLVSQVMAGTNAPNVLIDAQSSPHTNALKPSKAQLLSDADIVFRIGSELTPWLDAPLAKLSNSATVVDLLDSPGTLVLEFRDEDEEESDGHSDHADHDHDHEGADPHAWLDPANAQNWLKIIATELSKLDPENATQYTSNAAKSGKKIQSLTAQISATLEPVGNKNFIVYHDAFQYFERRFALQSLGSISEGDASQPSAKRIAAIQSLLKEQNVSCVFSEHQFNGGLVDLAIQGTDAKTTVLDPLGIAYETGPELYSRTLSQIAIDMIDCLK